MALLLLLRNVSSLFMLEKHVLLYACYPGPRGESSTPETHPAHDGYYNNSSMPNTLTVESYDSHNSNSVQ
jgi:hypothetical protein